jgi:hypothetical protein
MYALKFSGALLVRALKHDLSKFSYKETKLFARSPFIFKNVKYGSDEYKALLKKIKPALEEHYSHNRHHPEYFMRHHHEDRMNILDTIEMVIDWKAASRRHNDDDVVKSVGVNQKRFGFDEREYHMYLDIAETIGDNVDKCNVVIHREFPEVE